MNRGIRHAAAIGLVVLAGAASLKSLSRTATAGPPKGTSKHDTKPRIEPKSQVELIFLGGGKLHLGCEPQDTHCFADEKPGREIDVKPFWLGKLDVTAATYARCVDGGACTAPDTAGAACTWNVKDRETHPVTCIDWFQAQSFCKWMGGRLPTAEEWEFAAKGGESRIFPWGDDAVNATKANYCEKQCGDAHRDWTWTDASQDDGWASTSPVATYPQGATKQGLLDMSGNAAQWTSSDYDADTKEVRGGSWDLYARYLRASARVRHPAATKFDNVTVRCAQDDVR